MKQEVDSLMKSDLVLVGNKSAAEIEQMLKEANFFTSGVGKALDWAAPNLTKDYIRPAWQGVKTEWNAGNRSFDNLASGGMKSIEANRFNQTGLGSALENFGVKINKDVHGVPDYKNMINYGGTFDNIKSNIGGWLGNAGKYISGAIPLIGSMASSLFKGQAAQQPNVMNKLTAGPTPNTFSKYGSSKQLVDDPSTRANIIAYLND